VLSHRLAESIELAPPQVETVRLAALVHDVGLRLLDYDHMYQRRPLSAVEMRGLQEHPIVGAALVEPLLGVDVAQAVLHHHERVDGTGYPSRMSGNSIPGGARIIQICDAWVAMTSPRSYQPRVGVEEASWRIRQGAGTQFDEALTAHFLKNLDVLTE
jgi:HD-GYP domain-containing protein (c-di-GMP phosphodiesterase class II)